MASAVGRVHQPEAIDSSVASGTKRNTWGKIEHEISSIARTVFEGIRLVFVKFGQVRMDANAFGRIVQLGVHVFSIAEIAIKKPGNFLHISSRLGKTKNVIDTIQTLDSVYYFGNKENKKSAANCLGYSAMFVASAGLGMEILNRCHLLSLGKIAEKIGSVPVFGAVTRIGLSFGQVCSGFAALGYGCFGVDAIERLIDAKNGDDKRQAWIDLAWFVSEVAATLFLAFASTCIAGVIGFGVVAATLGTTSYLHSIGVKEKEAELAASAKPAGK